ncbi:MAG: chemotaxis response regulator protein-glutamate methylesterase [Capsulimonadaceae bacterium]|nr:chemotaxis response regulator protein-glutamate methylesterase [Capsulimonadaceae bacterium]
MATHTTKVLIVDDSALMRQILTRLLSSDPEIEVVGTAVDPFFARDKIKALLPDVLTLDVEMPRMDGITFLEKLMKAHPMPVIMVSSMTKAHCDITIRALEIGAVDFVQKPNVATSEAFAKEAAQIVEKVKAAGRARIGRPRLRPLTPIAAPSAGSSVSAAPRLSRPAPSNAIIAIGASTGGTEAIREVLLELPEDTPPIVIVQHMPPNFTASFAARLDQCCKIRVKEAADGDKLARGLALLAPGGFQMGLKRTTTGYAVTVMDAGEVNRHKPSVDYLFDSIAEIAGKNVTAAILTGMGADGANGMRRLRDAGARTIAQDAATCVVFGMPKEAIARGGAEYILPVQEIGGALLDLASTGAYAA